jgi:hypothetical protein
LLSDSLRGLARPRPLGKPPPVFFMIVVKNHFKKQHVDVALLS